MTDPADRWERTVAEALALYQLAQSPTVLSGDHRPAEVRVRRINSRTYEEQKRLFDRYHRGKEYVIDGVLHRGQ